MQVSSNIWHDIRHIDVLLFDQFSNHCLANTVEPLRATNALAGRDLYQWQFCTLDGAPVASSSGMQVAPHVSLADATGDTLCVMPSYGIRALDQWTVVRALRRVADRYGVIAGFDTGPWLLARAGLLDGRRATIHWDELTAFAEAFPDIDVQRERFVLDGPRITCSGAMAAFDLVTHLIGMAHGPLLATDVAHLFMSTDRTPAQGPAVGRPGRMVARALNVMQAHLEQPVSIPDIARRIGCTQKTLESRMREAMQATPQAVYHRLRLNRAYQLVIETDQPVSEIAGRCGYDNASAMTRAFRTAFHATPTQVRRRQ
ncbi:GlxA family transcriptional regulator [uncultured Tateyamaria sp.]|uniref:GlxA family transcriptional regulator n=1 Tax=uncultured Tateyamaria sp. TaxID=455651 RepID=UPI0026256C40|nr:GlxA family transcriptional regulator [uncultured Tateyamaria sp.]